MRRHPVHVLNGVMDRMEPPQARSSQDTEPVCFTANGCGAADRTFLQLFSTFNCTDVKQKKSRAVESPRTVAVL